MFLENFSNQIYNVFKNGVFGISLTDLGVIFFSFIFALLIRGLFARFIVKKVKTIVKKTPNFRLDGS